MTSSGEKAIPAQITRHPVSTAHLIPPSLFTAPQLQPTSRDVINPPRDVPAYAPYVPTPQTIFSPDSFSRSMQLSAGSHTIAHVPRDLLPPRDVITHVPRDAITTLHDVTREQVSNSFSLYSDQPRGIPLSSPLTILYTI